MSIIYDNSLTQLLISYLNPQRETLKEFIFRDNNGLYKYETDISNNLIKNYIKSEVNELLIDTCKKIYVRENNLKNCHNFLFNSILNFNSNKFKNIIKNINKIALSNKDFFDVAKDEINNLDFNIVLSLLKNLNFKEKNIYNNYYNTNLIVIESVTEWISKLGIENKKIILKIPLFHNYLQLLVDFINSNPSILNTNLNEFHSQLYYLKNYTELLENIYNKNALYNEILLSKIDNPIIKNFAQDLHNQFIEINKLWKDFLILLYNDNKELNNKNFSLKDINLIDSFGSIKNIYTIIGSLIRNIKLNEEKIIDILTNILNYSLIANKSNNLGTYNLDQIKTEVE